jgi:hypothetical protein
MILSKGIGAASAVRLRTRYACRAPVRAGCYFLRAMGLRVRPRTVLTKKDGEWADADEGDAVETLTAGGGMSQHLNPIRIVVYRETGGPKR